MPSTLFSLPASGQTQPSDTRSKHIGTFCGALEEREGRPAFSYIHTYVALCLGTATCHPGGTPPAVQRGVEWGLPGSPRPTLVSGWGVAEPFDRELFGLLS